MELVCSHNIIKYSEITIHNYTINKNGEAMTFQVQLEYFWNTFCAECAN
jgi:hypothetical protein